MWMFTVYVVVVVVVVSFFFHVLFKMSIGDKLSNSITALVNKIRGVESPDIVSSLIFK